MTKSSSVIPRFDIETEDTDLVNQTIYLGFITDDNLKWYSQIKNMQNKILRALGLLKYAKQYATPATLKDVYRGIVEHIFNYSCSVCGSCGTSRLPKSQKLQDSEARIVTNNSFDSSAESWIQELGWPTIAGLFLLVQTFLCHDRCFTMNNYSSS